MRKALNILGSAENKALIDIYFIINLNRLTFNPSFFAITRSGLSTLSILRAFRMFNFRPVTDIEAIYEIKKLRFLQKILEL